MLCFDGYNLDVVLTHGMRQTLHTHSGHTGHAKRGKIAAFKANLAVIKPQLAPKQWVARWVSHSDTYLFILGSKRVPVMSSVM